MFESAAWDILSRSADRMDSRSLNDIRGTESPATTRLVLARSKRLSAMMVISWCEPSENCFGSRQGILSRLHDLMWPVSGRHCKFLATVGISFRRGHETRESSTSAEVLACVCEPIRK